jgi:protoporphyrinogen/coproporphyrinogen III oxidase
MKQVAIIGGGIAGLSAAYYLERARQNGAAVDWTLFEKSNRLGGVIQTEHRDGFVLEGGPDSFLTAKPEASQLCRDLGIGKELIGSNDAQRKTYILLNERLVAIPAGLEFMVPTRLWPMARTPLFSFATKVRMLRERKFGSIRPSQQEDESVAAFVRRHFGQEVVDRVAEPLLAGVYGGDADQLSVSAVLPRFVEMEREHGSLVRATLAARKQRTASGSSPQPLFTSLRAGMGQIVEALLNALPSGSVLTSYDVSIQRSANAWQVATGQGSRHFDEVLLAVPAPAAAALLTPVQPELAAMLGAIRYTSSATVLLAFDRADLPSGFGFLVPRSEGRKMLACTFLHRKFPHRAPEDSALLRCFFSSSRVRRMFGYSEAALLDLAQRELQEMIGLTATPRFARVFRCECALPQYEVGHLGRVATMEKHLAGLPGTHVIGNSFYGVGIPDCVKSARRAVETITSAALQPASV